MQVLFPVNEPNEHWALGELHIRSGVLTIYDSLPKFSRTREWWTETMPARFEYMLPLYLKEQGVLKAKGVDVDGYRITWKYAEDAPQQSGVLGDCGIWVCINLYRLSHNMSLKVHNPMMTAICYRERIAEYLWKYKLEFIGQ